MVKARKESSLGILVYIDNTPEMVEEFQWLYKSWIYSGNWRESDLLVVHHPAVGGYLPKERGVISIPCLPSTQADTYRFLNSISCLSGEHIDALAASYPFLLRTDADVFLTRPLASFRPSFPVYGRGHYQHMDDFRENMLLFCKKNGVRHHHRFGCGHSLLASSEVVIPFLRRQVYWCNRLLEEFGDDEANWGSWPGWFRGVTTMYAAEITANEDYPRYLAFSRERVLDVESDSDELIDGMTFHIHAIHTARFFSKHHFRAGAYREMEANSLDRQRINQYCQWIAVSPVEVIKQLSGYPE